jgi:NADPH-dependent 7-cyano-7-deazaguanine reductase QueF
MVELKTVPNERPLIRTEEEHEVFFHGYCPVSQNPRKGSKLVISYTPGKKCLEVVSLVAYVESYTGGRGDVRSMEAMVQQITSDCSKATGATVRVFADLILEPFQKMRLTCTAYPEPYDS